MGDLLPGAGRLLDGGRNLIGLRWILPAGLQGTEGSRNGGAWLASRPVRRVVHNLKGRPSGLSADNIAGRWRSRWLRTDVVDIYYAHLRR